MTTHVFELRSRIFSAIDAPEMLYWVAEILEAGAKSLVIDLKSVSFMDGSGLGALVIAHNRAQKVGSKLCLCALRGQARMLIEAAGMEQMFEIYTNLDEIKSQLPESTEFSIESSRQR